STKSNFISYIESTGNVNIRSGPSTDYKIIGRVSRGEVYKLVDITDNGWYNIVIEDGIEAWISKNYGKAIGNNSSGNVNKKPISYLRTTGNINMRSGPSSNTDKIGRANRGEVYEVLGTANNGWYNIRTSDGGEAWISNNYAIEIKEKEIINNIQSIPISYLQTIGGVNIRSGSSSGTKKIGRANRGEIYQVLDISNDWYKVRTKSVKISWISTKYIQLLDYIKVTNPVLNVREGSSSSYKVIDQVYEREIYKIIDTASNGWYKIKTESGNIGWVSNNLVKETAYNLKDKQKLNFAYLKITGGVNIREGDNSKYKKIGRAKRNETYLLQDVSDNGWYKIRTKEGAAGWVSNKYANPIKSIKVNNPVLNVRS